MVKDAFHEMRIRYHKALMLFADAVRRRHHDRFMRLIRARSQEQVARMERERGLV